MKQESWNCKKCNVDIGGHNQYLHDGMCDDCYFKEYFPDDQADYEKRTIKKDNKIIDPVGLTQEDFEKVLNLTEYIEAKEGNPDKSYVDTFFKFLERGHINELTVYELYDGEINRLFNLPLDEIKENLCLEHQKKGKFFDEDLLVSQAFTDEKSFFAIVQKGIIFFSGNYDSSKLMQETLKETGIAFYLKKISKSNEQNPLDMCL